MNHGLKERYLDTIHAYLQQEPGVEKAILFGSRATGSHRETSDIDIAILGEQFDILQAASLKSKIEEETTIPYFIDIIAYKSIKSQDLKQHIQKEGVVIYEKGDG